MLYALSLVPTIPPMLEGPVMPTLPAMLRLVPSVVALAEPAITPLLLYCTADGGPAGEEPDVLPLDGMVGICKLSMPMNWTVPLAIAIVPKFCPFTYPLGRAVNTNLVPAG
jgi:hypothetical protein